MIKIGKYILLKGVMPGNIWIEISEDDEVGGEGGDFAIEKLEKVIDEFYEKNF